MDTVSNGSDFVQQAFARRSRCPRGSWRDLDGETLHASLLSLSQIVIRHEDVLPGLVPLSVLDWNLGIASTNRTIDDAYSRGDELVSTLRRGEISFERVLSASEDPVTRADGGRLGVFPASEFSMWPEMLDCLEPLSLGEFSTAIATPFGVHIFRRDPLPPEELFSADRLVIGYEGAGFLRYVAKTSAAFENSQRRKRDEAFRLATELRSRASGENFGDLVAEFSEHRDGGKGGDVGVWSSREPTIFPRMLDAILRTREGEVSEPVDSELGFQIFLRKKPTERARFALRARRIAFEPDADPSESNSRQTALRIASDALAQWSALLHRGTPPHDLPDIGELETWTLGRGPDGVDDVIALVEPGRPLREPVLSDYTYIIGVRVEPPSPIDVHVTGRDWLVSAPPRRAQ